MDSRGVLALIACLAFIFIYYSLVLPVLVPRRPAPEESPHPVTTSIPGPEKTPPKPVTPKPLPLPKPEAEAKEVSVTTDILRIEFTTFDAGIKSIELLDYFSKPGGECVGCDEQGKKPLRLISEFEPQLLTMSLQGKELPQRTPFALTSHENKDDKQVLTFDSTFLEGKLLVRKVYTIYNSERLIETTVEFRNISKETLELSGYLLCAGAGIAYESPRCGVKVRSEIIGHGNGTRRRVLGKLRHRPIRPGTVRIASGNQELRDDSLGSFIGAPGAPSAVYYSTGAFEVVFKNPPPQGAPIVASYCYDVPGRYLSAVFAGISGNSISIKQKNPGQLKKPLEYSEKEILWAGVQNRYFTYLVHPRQRETVWGVEARRLTDAQNMATFIRVADFELPPGSTETHSYVAYIGPKSPEALSPEKSPVPELYSEARFSKLLSYRWLDPLSRLLAGMLHLGYRIFRNYGVAVILLTVIVRLCMYPLSKKSQKSMLIQQKLQPEIKKIQERYKDDKARQQQEMMKLFRQYGVSPLGGCLLPMVIQLPIFIGLYRALLQSVELRQAPFMLWIDDLSQPDCLVCLPWKLPMMGGECLNIFPILFVGMMILQQKLTPKAVDPQQASMQRMMMIMFSVMMLFIFYGFPSGLYLYFLTSSGWGLVEQRLIKKKLEKEGLPKPVLTQPQHPKKDRRRKRR